MQSVFVIVTKLIACKHYFCKEFFCNNFGRDGICRRLKRAKDCTPIELVVLDFRVKIVACTMSEHY